MAAIQILLLQLTIRIVLLGAVPRNVAGLATMVTALACGIQGSTAGSGAIARDVAELSASIALHRLRLAVSGEVVRASALVASSARSTGETATGITTIASTRNWSAAAQTVRSVGAGTLDTVRRNHVTEAREPVAYDEMAELAAVVATPGGRASAAQAKRWAVGLNVTQTLAVVALLCVGSAREGAIAGFVVCSSQPCKLGTQPF